MARKLQKLINYHTSGTGMPASGDVALGEIVVRHNDERPELLIEKTNGTFATFIDSGAVDSKIGVAKADLQGKIDAIESDLSSNYATSANTVAAINGVDAKFANYATSANTVAAINAVDDKFASYATSAATAAAIKAVQDDVDANEATLKADYATSAATVAAIKKVDDKFANYATSANTVAAINAVDDKFANYATSAATAAAIKAVQDDVDANEATLKADYATSAATVAAIKRVDDKFASYATSAATAAAIKDVDDKFASYATSADTAAAIKVVQDDVDALEGELDVAISALTETINNKVSAAYIYKGSCTYAQLSTKEQVIGHVYNVTDAHGNVPAGTNYAWNGTAWDALAGTVDLTIYATSANTVAAIKAVQDDVDANEATLKANYATSAATVAAIKKVDDKFASYATSANTVAAINGVDAKFANYATSAATAAAIKAVQDDVDANEATLKADYATSAATVAAIKKVDDKFANYATSANTVAAINGVDAKFANYATSAATAAAIKDVQDDVDAVEGRVATLESLTATTNSAIQKIEVSGITGVDVVANGTTRTLDFTDMVIDCGDF